MAIPILSPTHQTVRLYFLSCITLLEKSCEERDIHSQMISDVSPFAWVLWKGAGNGMRLCAFVQVRGVDSYVWDIWVWVGI